MGRRPAVPALCIAGLFLIFAAPASAVEYLSGGGFEGGTPVILKEAGQPDRESIDHPDWQESDNIFEAPICAASMSACGAGGADVGPRGGQNWVLFGGYTGSEVHKQAVSQTVTLPAVEKGAIGLHVWVREFKRESALNVRFDQAPTAHLERDDLVGVGPGYQPLSFEIPIAGGGTIEAGQHQVTLQFISDSGEQASSVTTLSVDDVSLTATPVPTVGPPAPGGGAPGGGAPVSSPETKIDTVQLYKAKAGKTGSAAGKRPTFLKAVPGKSGKPAKAKFAFSGSGGQGELVFECKLDRGAFGPCTSPVFYRRLKLGAHNFEVRAVDRAGNRDETPATYAFKATAGKSGKFKK